MQIIKPEDISDDVYDSLAKVFYPRIVEFFADTKNQDAYEKDQSKCKSQLAV